MSDNVLISIRPEWCAMIANGDKTVEVRKTRPKQEPPFRCFIYCTNSGRPLVYGDVAAPGGWAEMYTQTYGYNRKEAERIWGVMNGKVIGEFDCLKIESMYENILSGRGNDEIKQKSCLSGKELNEYSQGRELYGWYISELKMYDGLKELADFGLKHPPQSWCYVKEAGHGEV